MTYPEKDAVIEVLSEFDSVTSLCFEFLALRRKAADLETELSRTNVSLKNVEDEAGDLQSQLDDAIEAIKDLEAQLGVSSSQK